MRGLTRRISIFLPGIVVFFMAVCVASVVCFATGENEVSPGGAELSPTSAQTPLPETLPQIETISPPFEVEVLPKTIPLPQWALQQETLSFRIDFLGMTVGYATFRYLGTVSIDGKTAHRINVKAWTSGALSVIYSVSENVEYYLDAETIQPIRIEYVGRKNKRDDFAVYDQKNGKITYFHADDGTIRKTVDIVPSCYDPVSVVYYLRWQDMGKEDTPVNLYAGRKTYQIASRWAGNARLKTKIGQVDTLVVEPVIWREGKIENKGEFRIWVTDDDRRVPVKIFGKFHKIKDWTLVGELIPEQPGS